MHRVLFLWLLIVTVLSWWPDMAAAQTANGTCTAGQNGQVASPDANGNTLKCNGSTWVVISGPGLPSVRTMYASICDAVVNTSTLTSTFCPVGTDPNSVTSRTYAANTLTTGKAFKLDGGGTYTVPTANGLTATINILVGASTVMTVTTPAAPYGSNSGLDFHALCTVRTATTINCTGVFSFNIGTGDTPVTFSQTSTFTPGVSNVIDVQGKWNGTVSTHNTTVSQAVLTALN